MSAAPAVSERRLWYGLLAAPAAWAVQGAAVWLTGLRACAGGRMPAMPAPGVRWSVGAIGLVAILVAASGVAAALGSWRRESGTTPEDGRRRFMALAGLVASAVIALGVAWASLPAWLLDVCDGVR
jgi:hypothetical protein